MFELMSFWGTLYTQTIIDMKHRVKLNLQGMLLLSASTKQSKEDIFVTLI